MEKLIQKHKKEVNRFFDKIDYEQISKLGNILIEKRKTNNVFFSGIGKSFNIAKHTGDVLKSLGFPSFSMHPIEALHGDMGAIRKGDVVVFYSKSGNTREVLNLIVYLKQLNIHIVGVFCNPNGNLIEHCHQTIILPCGKELDNDFDLVPTTSFVIYGLFCNLLVSYCMSTIELDINQYGINHPSGNIGKRVWLKVSDIMYSLERICLVTPDETILNVMIKMSSKHSGYCLVVNRDDNRNNDKNNSINNNILLKGIVSDGDIRRYITQNTNTQQNINANLQIPIIHIATLEPISIKEDMKVVDVVRQIKENNSLMPGIPILNQDGKLSGFIDTKKLMKYMNIL